MALVLASSSLAILLILLPTLLKAGYDTEVQYKYVKAYDGPRSCTDIILENLRTFSEYPTSSSTQVNFLEMFEPCNYEAEKQFMEELRAHYVAQRAKGETIKDIMAGLGVIWEKWRSHTVSGSAEGDRICNPRRLLSCHESLSECVCRQKFDFGDSVTNKWYTRIQTSQVRRNQYLGHNTWENGTVEACEVKRNGICDWELPWFGFCSLPCSGGNVSCIGQNETSAQDRGRKVCTKCYLVEGIHAPELCERPGSENPAIWLLPSSSLAPVILGLYYFLQAY